MKNKRNNISSLAIAGAAIGIVLAACGDPDGGQQLAADVGGFVDQPAVIDTEADQTAARAAETARLQAQADEYLSRPQATVATSQAAVIAEALEQQAKAKATVPTLDPSIQAAVDRYEASREAKASSIPTVDPSDAASDFERRLHEASQTAKAAAATEDVVPDLRMR